MKYKAMVSAMIMLVEFYKRGDGRLCSWAATPPHRRQFQGTTMAAGRDLPHDLTQFTIERALDIRDGFWALLAHGGSFSSVPGRRPTTPGRALVRAHHAGLVATEHIVNRHFQAWRDGSPTPVKPSLDAMYARWLGLAENEPLALEWEVGPLPAIGAHRQPQKSKRVAIG